MIPVELNLDGHTNMARDCELLARAEAGEAGCRVYTWNGVWVSLGRNQLAADALIDPVGTPWVQRPTGGGAVLHGHDVTVALALPFAAGVRDTYRFATAPLVDALNKMGVAAVLAENLSLGRTSDKAPSQDCFASVSRNDIADPVTGRKVCGCALRSTRGAVLIQASIPAIEPLRPPHSIIVGGVTTGMSEVDPFDLAAALGNVDRHR